MEYKQEDREYIENILNKCIIIEQKNNIYYITSKNIQRLLKYNKILNKRKIKIDLTKLTAYENLILNIDKSRKQYYFNKDIWNNNPYFYVDNIYGLKFNYIENILKDIFIYKYYTLMYNASYIYNNLNKIIGQNYIII